MGAADPQIPVGNLPFAGFPSQLEPDFIELRNSRGPHRVPLGLQAAGSIDGLGAIEPGKAFGRGLVPFPGLEEAQVFGVAVHLWPHVGVIVVKPRRLKLLEYAAMNEHRGSGYHVALLEAARLPFVYVVVAVILFDPHHRVVWLAAPVCQGCNYQTFGVFDYSPRQALDYVARMLMICVQHQDVGKFALFQGLPGFVARHVRDTVGDVEEWYPAVEDVKEVGQDFIGVG